MASLFRAESLPALFGFEDDKDRLSTEFSIRHAAVNKGDYSGIRHGVMCKLELDDDKNPQIKVDHWSHFPGGTNQLDTDIEISFKRVFHDDTPYYQISKLKIFDKTYIDLDQKIELNNPFIENKLPAAIKTILETIDKENQVADIPTILEDFGIPLPNRGRRTMTGIRRGGQMTTEAGKPIDQEKILFRRSFIPSMVGVEPHANEAFPGPTERHDIVLDPETGKQFDLFYVYTRDKNKPGSMTVTSYIREDQKSEPTKIMEIETQEQKDNPQLTEVVRIEMLDREIDVKDETVLTRALETFRMHNLSIRGRHYSLGEGDLFSEILHETGLIPHIFKRPEAPSIKDGGRFRGRVLGGVNEGGTAVSEKENSIGGNSYAASFDYKNEKGEEKSFSVIVDDGIGFLDYEKDGFDYWKASLDPYLGHRSDPADFKPETETLALVYTHKHKDHFFWETGYKAPVLIMEPLTYRQFVDDLKQNKDLSEKERDDLIAQCHVVDPAKDVNPDNPDEKIIKQYGDTIVEQYTEVFDNPETKSGKDYAPRLRLYKKGEEEGAIELRLNYVTHSTPCMMVDIVTPAKTVGLTGDFKFSQDVYVGKPTNKAWISAVERDFLLMETTGADRKEKTPEYSTLEDNYTDFFYDRATQGRRLILPIMPNDVNTLFTVANALKRARAKILQDNPESEALSYFTADGKTLEDMVRYLNDNQGLFKKMMLKDEYDGAGNLVKAGVKLMTRTSKEIKDLAKRGDPRLTLAVTGTQCEDMGVMTRAADDELDRWEIGPKDTILNTKKGIPVGYNIFKRRSQKETVESNFGAEYILPEEYEKEHGKVMSVSGHGGAEDLRLMIEASNARNIGVTHGTSDRFDIVEDMIRKAGKKSLRLSHQEERGGTKEEDYDFIAQREEYRQLAREVYPKPFFWRKKWSDKAVVKMMPVLNGPIGAIITSAEEAAINNKEQRREHRRRFVASNDNPHDPLNINMLQQPAIGVQKLKNSERFYDKKKIGMIASADTEGTGLVEEKARLSQYAHHVRDLATRKELYNEELKMRTPLHVVWSLHAALVTVSHPKDFEKGDTPRVFAHNLHESLAKLKYHPEKDEPTNTVLLGFNFHRHDSQLISKELGLNGQRDLFMHRSSGIYLFDVRQFARMVNGYAKDTIKVNRKAGANGGSFLDFSLQGLCEANGIDYPNTHRAIDDTYPAYALYEFIEKKLEAVGRTDILDQALINCDTKTDDIAKDIVGEYLRPGTPKPVFSYISHRADRPEPRLGTVIGTELNATSGRALIVYNLAHDPDKYMDLSEKDLTAMAKDPKCDVFDIIYLDRHPIIAPMDFAFSQMANKSQIKQAKETIIARSRMISRNLTRSIEQNATARNANSKRKKVIPFETRVLEAFGKALNGMYGSMRKKDKRYHSVDYKVYAIPKLKSEWGLIKRSSEDMKAYHIAPSEGEISTGKDLQQTARMILLLGQLNNKALTTLTEENLYDVWQELNEDDRGSVSRIVSSMLRQEYSMDAGKRASVKKLVMDNLQTALDNVEHRRAQQLNASSASNHMSLKKAKIQYDRMMRDEKLRDNFVGGDKEKQRILDAWPDYLRIKEDDPIFGSNKAHNSNRAPMKRLAPRKK